MGRMDYVEELKKVYLFKDLAADEIAKLASVAHEYGLFGGEALFREGHPGDEFFVIVMGTARIIKQGKDGESEQVALLASGSYFGEIGFINADHIRTASVEILERSSVLGFKRADVVALLEADEKLAHHFYRALATGLARRLEATTEDAAHYKAIAGHRS
jgi:CRP/FNR family transcriptional regulator, cyclic AMP receptor protein